MSDDPKGQTPNDGQGTTPSETPAAANGKTSIASLPPDIQAYIAELRTEAETNRKAKAAADAAAKAAEEAQLAKNQEWQKLAESRREELEKLKPVADQHEAITAAFNASLDNRLKQIPDDVRKKAVDPVRAALSPVEFSNWLDANLETFQARRAPGLDGGAGASGGGKSAGAALTAADLEMARAMNIKPEDWAKRKAELAERQANPRKE